MMKQRKFLTCLNFDIEKIRFFTRIATLTLFILKCNGDYFLLWIAVYSIIYFIENTIIHFLDFSISIFYVYDCCKQRWQYLH
ncbi:hypothetical protein Mgra_00005896, partial [Meloidogyne graminicola]